MERIVEEVYSQEMLETFLESYNLGPSYTLLGDFENYVYEVSKNNQSYILRVTHSSHRSEREILAELEWINFLAEQKVNVPTVFSSNNNHIVEKQTATDQSIFFACLFSKVKGKPIQVKEEIFNESLFQQWGKETGKMHRVTLNYHPKELHRKFWYEDDLFELEMYTPDEPLVITRSKEVIHLLNKLPDEDFGLIHNDIHFGNFFSDGEEIYIFDFDDSCLFWHVSDIAIPLYYSCYALFPDESRETEKKEFAKHFLDAFMKGYMTEKEPPNNWQALLPLFLKVRDITLYAALNKKIAQEDRSERIKMRMDQIKKRIEEGIPIVSIE